MNKRLIYFFIAVGFMFMSAVINYLMEKELKKKNISTGITPWFLSLNVIPIYYKSKKDIGQNLGTKFWLLLVSLIGLIISFVLIVIP